MIDYDDDGLADFGYPVCDDCGGYIDGYCYCDDK